MAHEKPAPEPTPSPVTAAALPATELRQLVDLLLERQPSQLDRLGISREAQQALVQPQRGRRYRRVKAIGDAGAKAILVVGEEPGFPTGKIMMVEGYTFPAGILTYVSAGGLVPDGLQIARDRDSGTTIALCAQTGAEPPAACLTFHYLEWKLETFYRADIRAWVGKGLKSAFCDPDGEGLSTPWDPAVQ